MTAIHHWISAHPSAAWLCLAASFVVLAKSAGIFVDSSVALAGRFRIPKFVIGILLVSFATTAPEFSVSLLSSLRGRAQIAMGNAAGSVICNSGLALSLAGLVAVAPIRVTPRVLRSAGAVLIAAELLALVFLLPDRRLGRLEGLVLVSGMAVYMGRLLADHRGGRYREDVDVPVSHDAVRPLWIAGLHLCVGLAGIIASSDIVIVSATAIARSLAIPEAIIAVTLIALGTSIPEVATCVTSARKGHGEIAVGNIFGANIINVCWVAGASAAASPIALTARDILTIFPWLLGMTGLMLAVLRRDRSLSRPGAALLLGAYAAYLAVMTGLTLAG